MAETLYGTHDDVHSSVMSERVQSLASGIYREFECMIGTYGDSVIKDLMPHIVSILENLNQAYREKQDYDVEIELLRVENENLKKQFEKEKQLRKSTEQRYLEGDDLLEEEKKLHHKNVETMESSLRRLEVRTKNLQEQILRHEERETEMKSEYTKLKSRYSEIFKTHADYVERYKIQVDKDSASPSRSGVQLPVLKYIPNSVISAEVVNANVQLELAKDENITMKQDLCDNGATEIQRSSVDVMAESGDRAQESEKTEKQDSQPSASVDDEETVSNSVTKPATVFPSDKVGCPNDEHEKEDNPDGIRSAQHRPSDLQEVTEDGAVNWSPDDAQDVSVEDCLLAPYADNMLSLMSVEFDDNGENLPNDNTVLRIRQSGSELHNTSSIYEELSQQDSTALVEMDGGVSLAGVTAEVEKLIRENNELLETKNALNVVKDDLINKVDELLGEQELLHEELTALQTTRDKHLAQIAKHEDELKKVKEELEELRLKTVQLEDDDKKCFTRIDMTRVVMERNQFKEKLMDLQEAVRFAEMVRASKEHPDLFNKTPKKKSTLWNFFSGLVSSSDQPKNSQGKQSFSSSSSSSSKPPTVI